jgi:hypothetical protein
VTSLNPLEAIEVGVTRRAPGAPAGAPWLPHERVSRARVLLTLLDGHEVYRDASIH